MKYLAHLLLALILGGSATLITPIESADAQIVGIDDVLCIISPAACIADEVVDAAGSVLDEVGERVSAGFSQLSYMFLLAGVVVLQEMLTWWIEIPNRVGSHSNTIAGINALFSWLTGAMVVAGIMLAGARMIFWARAEPLVETLRATITFLLATGLGVTVVQGAAVASDQLAEQWINESIPNPSFDQSLTAVSGMPFAVLFLLGVSMLIAGLIQAVLMALRETALIVLTGLIVFAAAGSFFPWGRTWLNNLISWILPLLLWKPIAALLISISYTFLINATGIVDVAIGMAMMWGSVFVIKPLRSIFTVFSPQLGSGYGAGSGSGGGFGSAIAAGAVLTHYSSSHNSSQAPSSTAGGSGATQTVAQVGAAAATGGTGAAAATGATAVVKPSGGQR